MRKYKFGYQLVKCRSIHIHLTTIMLVGDLYCNWVLEQIQLCCPKGNFG